MELRKCPIMNSGANNLKTVVVNKKTFKGTAYENTNGHYLSKVPLKSATVKPSRFSCHCNCIAQTTTTYELVNLKHIT